MRLVLYIALWTLCGLSILGQDLEPTKQVAPGSYPAAARAVRASGEVGVSVNINWKGEVISATAFSGHPLLRISAEAAARAWVFSKAEKDCPERTTLLFFRFTIGGFRMIDQSDKAQDYILTNLFPSLFISEVTSETLIPRLLLLPRVKEKVKPQYCQLHSNLMEVEIHIVGCEVMGEREKSIERSTEYNDAEDTEFPNANIEDMMGCRNDGVEREEVYFCPKCRIARSNWIQINK